MNRNQKTDSGARVPLPDREERARHSHPAGAGRWIRKGHAKEGRASREVLLYEISILGIQDTDNEHFLKCRRMVHLVGKRIPGYLVYLSRP